MSESLNSLEIEKAVIGAITDPQALPELVDTVAPADFTKPEYQNIFQGAVTMFQAGEPIDWLTLDHALETTLKPGQLDKARQAITEISASDFKSTTAPALYWARIVRDQARLRNFINEFEKIKAKGGQVKDVPGFIADATAKLINFSEDAQDKPCDLKSLAQEAFAEIEAEAEGKPGAAGLSTGFKEVDRLTGGLKPGQLWIVAGGTSQGKTSLGLQIALQAALNQVPTAFFSYEEKPLEILKRILTAMSGTPRDNLKRKNEPDKDEKSKKAWPAYTQAMNRLMEASLYVEPGQERTVSQLRARAQRLQVESGRLGLVLVDYVGLVKSDAGKGKTREREVAKISGDLKNMATALDCPVIALAQLNRQSAGREDGEPRLNDLRDSGAQEQDSDVVALVHRPGFFKKGKEHDPKSTHLILAKNRAGPTGQVNLVFDGPLRIFREPPGGF